MQEGHDDGRWNGEVATVLTGTTNQYWFTAHHKPKQHLLFQPYLSFIFSSSIFKNVESLLYCYLFLFICFCYFYYSLLLNYLLPILSSILSVFSSLVLIYIVLLLIFYGLYKLSQMFIYYVPLYTIFCSFHIINIWKVMVIAYSIHCLI